MNDPLLGNTSHEERNAKKIRILVTVFSVDSIYALIARTWWDAVTASVTAGKRALYRICILQLVGQLFVGSSIINSSSGIRTVGFRYSNGSSQAKLGFIGVLKLLSGSSAGNFDSGSGWPFRKFCIVPGKNQSGFCQVEIEQPEKIPIFNQLIVIGRTNVRFVR